MYTPASTAAEYRFQGNQPKIQNAYNYKKQVITGIHGLPFDQQNDDRYWQTKQILPNILRPLGSGIKNAAIINEGVYNINPIAGTNNFGGGDISLASGTNPTNYSIVNTTDIEDRLRAHAVPANDPLSAEFAKSIAPDAQLNPNSVEGDPMLNTFRSEESIMRNAASQIYDENLMPDGEEGDPPTESLVYGRLRANLLQASRTMKNTNSHDALRGMLIRNRNEAIRRGAAQDAGQVYDAENRREDLAAQAGNVGGPPGGFGGGGGSGSGGSGGGDMGGGGRTAFASGTHLNQPAKQVRNGRVGVNVTSKIGGSVMSQVDTIDNQNSANTTNNIRYNFQTASDVIDASIATAVVRPLAHQSVGVGQKRRPTKQARIIPESEMPQAPIVANKGKTKAVNKKEFFIGAGYGTQEGSMQIDQSSIRAFNEPATILSPQKVTQATKDHLEEEVTPTGGEYDIEGAVRELSQSDSSVGRAFGHELMGASNSYAYEAFHRVASMSDAFIDNEADRSLKNVQNVGPAINAVGDTLAKFIPTIKPPSVNKPVVDPSDVKMKQDNLRLQKELDDAINQTLDLKEQLSNASRTSKVYYGLLEESSKEEKMAKKGYGEVLDQLLSLQSDRDATMERARKAEDELGIVKYAAKGVETKLNQYKTKLNEYQLMYRDTLEDLGSLQKHHQTTISQLNAELGNLGKELQDAHSAREVDIALINDLHGQIKEKNQQLEHMQNYIPPYQVESILQDYQRIANEIKHLREQPPQEIIKYRDTYLPSQYEGTGMSSGKRKLVDSNIKNSLDSTHMLAGSIPGDSLPVPGSNLSTTNQLSQSNNLPNMLDQRERIVSETKELRNYAQTIVGGGAVTERYEQAIAEERREKEQKAELSQLIARVGRLVDSGKKFGSNVTSYTQEDLIRIYIQEINDSVTSASLSGCSTSEIVGAVNSALEVSAIKFHQLSIKKSFIQANVSYGQGNMTNKVRAAILRDGDKRVLIKPTEFD